MPTEQERAELSKERGQAATQISDPEKKRKFIAAQGDAEAKKPGTMTDSLNTAKLSAEAQAVSATKGAKGLESYKHGTDRVPKTGPAIVHQDEAVLPKHDADKYREAKGKAIYDLAAEHMGGEKKSPKEIKEMRIRKGHSGGHIVEHHHTHPEHHPMEEHVMPNMDALHDHLEEHMGTPNPGEAEANAGQSGIEQMASGGAAA